MIITPDVYHDIHIVYLQNNAKEIPTSDWPLPEKEQTKTL